MFEVNLIRVPNPLTAEQRTELADNGCRHLTGSWWIFEGDVCALRTPAEVVATGLTPGLHPDDIADGDPIIEHAIDIFDLSSWPPPSGPSWVDHLTGEGVSAVVGEADSDRPTAEGNVSRNASSAADEFPEIARIPQGIGCLLLEDLEEQAERILVAFDRLRAWKAEALAVIGQWEQAWEALGRPGRLGESKADATVRTFRQLREERDAWMNGVADVVEPLGYDRQAACGPADLLPGLLTLAERASSFPTSDGSAS